VAPRFGLPVDEAKIQACLPRARTCLDEISRLLGDQTYLAGETVSIADLMLIPHLSFLTETSEGHAMLAPHEKLRAWISRMEARPSMRNTAWDKLAALAMAS
jgi:glutathione S-transferase